MMLQPAFFPSVVGRRPKKRSEGSSSFGKTKYIVGQTAIDNRKEFILSWPREEAIADEEEMEALWRYLFEEELFVDPSKHPVFVTEHSFRAKQDREQMAKMLFETFNVPAVFFGNDAQLSLYGYGKTTGIVVMCGHTRTFAVPVVEGCLLMPWVSIGQVTGEALDGFLERLLTDAHNLKPKTLEDSLNLENAARTMKETKCYVASCFDVELTLAEKDSKYDETVVLPIKGAVTVNTERFVCPEALFRPGLCGREEGLHELIYNCIRYANHYEEEQLLENIVLAGGSSLFPGLAERLEVEAESLIRRMKTIKKDLIVFPVKVRVFSPPQRKELPWIGGSAMSALPEMKSRWIKKDAFDKGGPSIVHRYCPSFCQ